jgi:hypothetical protein
MADEEQKCGFLADPLQYTGDDPPKEWVSEGWRQAEFQDALVYILARSVGKTGGFALAEDYLRWVSGALTPSQAQDLYGRVRDESERLELEWRPAFQDAFPGVELPEAQDEEVVVGTMREVIEIGAGLGFEGLLETLLELPCADRELDPALPDSLVSLARRHRRGVIVSLLEEARRARQGQGPR